MVISLSTLASIFSSRVLFSSKKMPYAKGKRSAFSLIEVIFAIVIMGIVIVSLPVMMDSNQKGVSTTIIQEAIFGASTELNQALSYRWDENSRDDLNNSNGLSYVVETGDCGTNRLRPGHIVQPLHRRCVDSNLTTATIAANFGVDGDDAGELDDIDDINILSKDMFTGASSITGYKQKFKSSFSIVYTNMGGLVNTKDAKIITITVKDGSTIITSLRSYTLNIGEVDIYKKMY